MPLRIWEIRFLTNLTFPNQNLKTTHILFTFPRKAFVLTSSFRMSEKKIWQEINLFSLFYDISRKHLDSYSWWSDSCQQKYCNVLKCICILFLHFDSYKVLILIINDHWKRGLLHFVFVVVLFKLINVLSWKLNNSCWKWQNIKNLVYSIQNHEEFFLC